MYHISPKQWNTASRIIILFFSIVFILQAIVSYFLIQLNTLHTMREKNVGLLTRIKNDLAYKNGVWDTARYNADPLTPHPDGVGGFSQPLYILTKEGFVLERNMPIHGLLDSSSLDHILRYTQPQTFISPTNEEWRVISKPIIANGETIGAILVSRYNPAHVISKEIDQDLQANLTILEKSIQVTGTTIDTSNVTINHVRYNVTFEIVDKFNKVLINNGRTPSYIDVSYVNRQLQLQPEQYITDSERNIPYIVFTQSIQDDHKKPIGVVVIAESLSTLNQLLRSFVISTFITYVSLIIPLSFLAFYMLKKLITTSDTYEPKKITYNRKTHMIHIDTHQLKLPIDSYQYLLADSLFNDPKKVWSQEQFMKLFNTDNWRIIYDAAIAINKKSRIKLILYEDRTYCINPDYIHYITP